MNQAEPKVKLLPLDELLLIVNAKLTEMSIEKFFPGVEECQKINGNAGQDPVERIYDALHLKQLNRFEEETERIKFPIKNIKIGKDNGGNHKINPN